MINQQPAGWDLMFGLYASPYRKVAIEAMEEQIAAPDHAITSQFLHTLVELQVTGDSSWDSPSTGFTRDYADRRTAHAKELTKAEMEKVVAALPRKFGKARALTLSGLFSAGNGDPAIVAAVRPALIAAWADLREDRQQQLIQNGWESIASPEMLPVRRRIVVQPPPMGRTSPAMLRDAAAGRALIVADLMNPKAQPSIEVVQLLPKEDVVPAIAPAIEWIERGEARELDFQLLDHYADVGIAGTLHAVFEKHIGKWAATPNPRCCATFFAWIPATERPK